MPDGSLWIMGGVGIKKVLTSTEILTFRREKWCVILKILSFDYDYNNEFAFHQEC